jgi:phospholipid/cholesterol/gamma-HCH transport system substrate-binding protein
LTDYDTIQRKRNFIVGVFVLVALAAFVFLISIFGELPIAVQEIKSYTVYAQFPEAGGVARDTPVRLVGYQVGRVIGVEAPRAMIDLKTHQNYIQTVVVMAIDQQFSTIPSNASIKLMHRGLGSSFIEIKPEPNQPLVPLDPNRPETKFLCDKLRVQGSSGMTSEFFPEESQKKVEQLISSMITLINNTNVIIGDIQNQNNIKATLANLTQATKQATVTLEELQKLSKAGTEAVGTANMDMNKVANALVDTSLQLNKALSEMQKTTEKINSGQGSAGRLLNDPTLYENLLDSSREMELAMEQIKLFITQMRENGIPLSLFGNKKVK